MMPGGMTGWGWSGGYGYGIVGTLFMLLFWGLVIVALALLVRRLWRQGPGGTATRTEDDALEILKRRYARGEISRNEYLRMKQDLV